MGPGSRLPKLEKNLGNLRTPTNIQHTSQRQDTRMYIPEALTYTQTNTQHAPQWQDKGTQTPQVLT